MFFQHNVEVCAAEAVGADAAAAGIAIACLPRLGFVVEEERGVGKINIRVGRLRVEGGRQCFVVESQGSLEQAGCARARLEVTDVTLGRTEGDAVSGRIAENGLQTFHLYHVADAGAGAMGFHQGGSSGIKPRVFPCARRCQPLSQGIRGGDALALAIAGPAHAANDGVNAVAILFGIFQPLQQESGSAFAHHKAIGPIPKGAGSAAAEGADLAELHVAGNVHIAVHATRDHGVNLVFNQHGKSGFDGGKTGGAGCVGNEVGAAQVKDVGNTPRDDVG